MDLSSTREGFPHVQQVITSRPDLNLMASLGALVGVTSRRGTGTC